MDLVLGKGSYSRENGDFPSWELVNALLEPTPVSEKGFAILSRPPLVEAYDWGTGPIRGVFQRDGIFGGDIFVVSGAALYRNGVNEGAVAGGGPVKFAARAGELVVTAGTTAKSYKGPGDFVNIAFPDSADVRSVAFVGVWFLYVRGDGSGRVYWSDENDGRTIDALDYVTAESEPDELLDIVVIADFAWLLGTNTGEGWLLTGNSDAVIQRIVQRNLGRGVAGTGCAEQLDGTLYFVSDDGMMMRDQGQGGVRLSDGGLEEKIRQSAAVAAFAWFYEGHSCFTVRLDSGSWAYDVSTSSLSEMRTHGRANWAAQCSVTIGGTPYFGDDATGKLWAFGAYGGTDSGAAAFLRMFSAGFPLNTQPVGVVNVLIDGNAGSTDAETGQEADPLLEMSFSRDGGRHWSIWRATRWGRKGEYKRKARYGGCGYFGPPGALFRFRMNENAPLRVGNARVNESLAGRGR